MTDCLGTEEGSLQSYYMQDLTLQVSLARTNLSKAISLAVSIRINKTSQLVYRIKISISRKS